MRPNHVADPVLNFPPSSQGIREPANKSLSFWRSPAPSVVVVSGPRTLVNRGGKVVDHVGEAVARWKRQSVDVSRIGDGERFVAEDQVVSDIAKHSEGSLLIFYTHGAKSWRTHGMELGLNNTPTERLIRRITSASGGKRFDFVLAPCFAGVTQEKAMEVLPKGSLYITLGSGRGETAAITCESFIERASTSALTSNVVSTDRVMMAHLLRLSGRSTRPIISMAGVGSLLLDDLLVSRRGQKFTSKEWTGIHARLGEDFRHGPQPLHHIKVAGAIESNSPALDDPPRPGKESLRSAAYAVVLAAMGEPADAMRPLRRPLRQSLHQMRAFLGA